MGRATHQPMPHPVNPSLTDWKVKEEGKSSAHTACDQSDITYFLEGEGWPFVSSCDQSDLTYYLKSEAAAQFISPHHMQSIQRHLLAGE